MLTCKYISGSPHVCRKLIKFIKPDIIRNSIAKFLISQIANHKFICRYRAKLRLFDIRCPNPMAFLLQTLDQMTAYESPGSTNQDFFVHTLILYKMNFILQLIRIIP